MVRLAEEGHTVTSYNPFPKKYSIPNYSNVSLEGCLTVSVTTIEAMSKTSTNPFVSLSLLTLVRNDIELFKNCKPLTQLLDSTEKYDVLVTQSYVTDLALIYASKFDIPVVAGLPNTMAVPWIANRFANPSNPSYISNFLNGRVANVNFRDRVQNTLMYLLSLSVYRLWLARNDESVFKYALGRTVRSLEDVAKSTSILLVNTHDSLFPAFPSVPGVIQVGGMHVKSAEKPPKVSHIILMFIGE